MVLNSSLIFLLGSHVIALVLLTWYINYDFSVFSNEDKITDHIFLGTDLGLKFGQTCSHKLQYHNFDYHKLSIKIIHCDLLYEYTDGNCLAENFFKFLSSLNLHYPKIEKQTACICMDVALGICTRKHLGTVIS